uniref:Uncharacterized protein n=1 Tax=Lepeophtheirus salmonis TaxID=72036 RepID=A0A0K2TN81_LEPSM
MRTNHCYFLFDVSDLDYILLCKINSHHEERRFGLYKQINCAKFHVSIRQFFESKKKKSG